MSNVDSALKYRALLQISEALIANRDREALVRSLWDTLHPLISFDFLVIPPLRPFESHRRPEQAGLR